MSATRSEYPHRPSRKSQPISSSSGGGKRKSWVSLRDEVKGGLDVSARLNKPWWKSPVMKQARFDKWAKR